MSEAAAPAAVFNPMTVAALVVAGIVGFVMYLVLSTYAPQLSSNGGARANALSNSAVGFRGIVRLIGLSGGRARLVRSSEDYATEDLLVVALEGRTEPEALQALLDRRENLPTLVVLPKWGVLPDPAHPGWVQAVGPGMGDFMRPQLEVLDVGVRRAQAQTLAGADFLEGVAAPAPAQLQALTGEDVVPLVAAGKEGVVLGQVGEAPLYVLSDPDLINNNGIDDPAVARAALMILDRLNSNGAGSVAFDLTLNGLGAQPSALRIAFEPPFLPLTIALALAALLAGLHGAARFGAAAEEAPALAFGKSALVENSASLFRMARREHRTGGAYAELVREAAAYESGAHLALRDAELDAYLDRLSPPERPNFSALAERARQAHSRYDLLAAARALFQWKKDLIK
jgi:hypothetical protein